MNDVLVELSALVMEIYVSGKEVMGGLGSRIQQPEELKPA